MITVSQRRLIVLMVKLKLWKARYTLFGTAQVIPCWGTCWLFEKLLREQPVDDLWHAPACPANHWHRRALVFRPCTCGSTVRSPSTVNRESPT